MEKYRVTLKSSTLLSNIELAEVYDLLLEQAALKAKAEAPDQVPDQAQDQDQAQETSLVKTIRVSNDLMLEVWPKGSGDDDYPLVTLWSLGQDADGDRFGVVVIWQSEILPLIAALSEAAMMLTGEGESSEIDEGDVQGDGGDEEEMRLCPKCGAKAHPEAGALRDDGNDADVLHTIHYRCPECEHSWGVVVLGGETL